MTLYIRDDQVRKLAAELADRVATMYAGRIVELGAVRDIFYTPKHPYTLGLIKAVPPVAGELYEKVWLLRGTISGSVSR